MAAPKAFGFNKRSEGRPSCGLPSTRSTGGGVLELGGLTYAGGAGPKTQSLTPKHSVLSKGSSATITEHGSVQGGLRRSPANSWFLSWIQVGFVRAQGSHQLSLFLNSMFWFIGSSASPNEAHVRGLLWIAPMPPLGLLTSFTSK